MGYNNSISQPKDSSFVVKWGITTPYLNLKTHLLLLNGYNNSISQPKDSSFVVKWGITIPYLNLKIHLLLLNVV